MIAPLRDFNRTECSQMLGHILRVEQAVAARAQACDEMDQCDLGCVACTVKHALTKEGATKRYAVEPADECLAVVDFNGVAMSALEQRAINAADARIDPGAGAILLGLRTAFNHRVEVTVDVDGPRR